VYDLGIIVRYPKLRSRAELVVERIFNFFEANERKFIAENEEQAPHNILEQHLGGTFGLPCK
jgi:hypothetical protein